MSKSYNFKYHVYVVIVYIFVTIYYFLTRHFQDFTFQEDNIYTLFVISILMFIALLIAKKLLDYGEILLNKKSLRQTILLLIYSFILFALPEEIIFRFFIQGGIQNITNNPCLAIIFSSLIFGLAHILNGASGFKPKKWNWKLVIITFIAGLYFGLAYYLTQNLIIPIIMHAILIIINQLFLIKNDK